MLDYLPLILILSAASICVFVLTALMRKIALREGLLDLPNSRSSHTIPTPRGGGLSVVTVFCLFISCFGQGQMFENSLVIACILTGLVGMMDDIRSQPAKYRISIHLVSAAILVYGTGRLPPINFGFGTMDMGVSGYLIATIGAVWMVNLTNFMDGIDALVASQCTIASSVALTLLILTNMPTDLILPTALFASCVIGFLLLNLPPAKIFMGDVGSGTLGLIISGLMLWHTQVNAEWLFVWLILTGMLTVDASYTLLVRALRRQRLSEGHRSHAYQHLSQQLQSHKKVTLLEAGVSIVWLAPLASAVALGWLPGFWAMVVAYAPLIAACVWLKAGRDNALAVN